MPPGAGYGMPPPYPPSAYPPGYRPPAPPGAPPGAYGDFQLPPADQWRPPRVWGARHVNTDSIVAMHLAGCMNREVRTVAVNRQSCPPAAPEGPQRLHERCLRHCARRPGTKRKARQAQFPVDAPTFYTSPAIVCVCSARRCSCPGGGVSWSFWCLAGFAIARSLSWSRVVRGDAFSR